MYETLIIGRDVGCHIAALESVRLGRKTALIIEGETETFLRDGGYVFPSDPRPLSGIANSQLASDVMRHILSADREPALPVKTDPAFQIILPRHRIDVFQDKSRAIADLIREFPEHERKINTFCRASDKSCGLVEKRLQNEADSFSTGGRIVALLRRLSRVPSEIATWLSMRLPDDLAAVDLRRAIQAQLKFSSFLSVDRSRLPLSAGYLFSLPSRGLHYLRGGIDGWTESIRRLFIEGGGVLYDHCSVIRMETKDDITVDMEMAGAASTLRGGTLIVSSLWEKLNLMIPERRTFFPGASFSGAVPAAYPFHLHIGVRAGVIPEKMAPYAVVVRDGEGPLSDQDFVCLATSLPGDTEYAPEGRRAITATVFLKDSPLRMSDQDLKEEASNIVNSLDGFMPFLRENIDYLHVDKSISFSRRCHELSSIRYRTSRSPILGIANKPERRLSKNVLVVGGASVAALGLEGEILSGVNAARRAGG